MSTHAGGTLRHPGTPRARKTVVYNSFHGRFSCNPRAIYERLADRRAVEHVWLADARHAASFPRDVRTVDIGSAEARSVLERADFLVANTHTEVEWEKQTGTTYLQTWHGTPLKRIHHDVLWAPEGRLSYLDRDVARWDVLLSPNAPSSPRLRKAFGFDGTILETGYPRNDLLTSPQAGTVRATVRHDLGIASDVKAILYAPTWRDDECLLDREKPVPCGLDVSEFMDLLGDDHELLIRSHNMVTGRARVAEQPGVRDVSYFPDIRDLYLAADVLITDYSSAMFDFAVTGKPMFFFAYDLERYAESVRGFYFDFVPEAPGPVLSTTSDLAEAIAAVDEVSRQYSDRYDAFRATYCGWEDGHSTDRVLDLIGL
jgi:CDP-glycerol glycerophosphotransferase